MEHKASHRISQPHFSRVSSHQTLVDQYLSTGCGKTTYGMRGANKTSRKANIPRTRSSLRHGFVEKLDRDQLPDYRPYYSRFLQINGVGARGGSRRKLSVWWRQFLQTSPVKHLLWLLKRRTTVLIMRKHNTETWNKRHQGIVGCRPRTKVQDQLHTIDISGWC